MGRGVGGQQVGGTGKNPSHLSEWLVSKRQETTSVGEDVERRKLLATIGRNGNWCSHYGKQYGGSSKN